MASQKTPQVFAQVRKEGRNNLLETEAQIVCLEYGIPVMKSKLAKTPEEAVKSAEKIGYPVALKIVSPDVIHKSDVGGVMVKLSCAEEVSKAYAQILQNIKKNKPKAKIVGLLVQEMASSAIEVIVGAIKDPQFGPSVMFGLGGIFVEVLKDVTFRIAPISADEAREMISEVKAYPLLKGYRNLPPADIDAIVNVLLGVSRLMMEHKEIKELDLNPVLVYESGAKTVDARIILE